LSAIVRLLFSGSGGNVIDDKWLQFYQFLLERTNEKTAGDRLRYAEQFCGVLRNGGDAQRVPRLKPDK